MLKTGLRNLMHLIATAVLLVGLGTSTTALAAAMPGHQPEVSLMINDLTAAAPMPTPDDLLGLQPRDSATEFISGGNLTLMDRTLQLGAIGGLADDNPSSPAATLGLSDS